MPRPIRLLVALAAITAFPAVAPAQPPQDSTRAPERMRRGMADTSQTGRRVRMHPRDLVGADSRVCDDLCRRERMMDSLYGKDRERRPVPARPRAPRRP